MSERHNGFDRRRFIQSAAGVLLGTMLPLPAVLAKTNKTDLLHKVIPSTGEQIPAVGMGTWGTFNVGDDMTARANCVEVLKAFFAGGGGLVDSSPMYGSSEEVMGYCMARLKAQGVPTNLFSATKVWSRFQSRGAAQAQDSEKLWGLKQIDLQQIHNLLGWEGNLETLRQLKSEKRIRYIGITTSHGRRHEELEKLMRTVPMDFVQLTYNIVDTQVEQRLLPLAKEKGIAVLANRPFQRKGLFQQYGHKPLPKWAAEIGCHNWAQYFLKFIVSHPAVTCAIPATSQVAHMQQNMAAMKGPVPDEAMRKRMRDYLLAG